MEDERLESMGLKDRAEGPLYPPAAANDDPGARMTSIPSGRLDGNLLEITLL